MRTNNRVDIVHQIKNNSFNKNTQKSSEQECDYKLRLENQARYEQEVALEAAKKKQLMEQYKSQLDT